MHRKIILNTDINGRKMKYIKHSGLVLGPIFIGIVFFFCFFFYSTLSEQGAIPTLSLEFAHFCLKNAVATLPTVDADVINSLNDAANNGETSSNDGGQTYPAPFSNPMCVKEVYRLK